MNDHSQGDVKDAHYAYRKKAVPVPRRRQKDASANEEDTRVVLEQLKAIKTRMAVVKAELERRERRENRRNISVDQLRKRTKLTIYEARGRNRECVLEKRRNTADRISKDRKSPVEDPDVYFLVQDFSSLSCGPKQIKQMPRPAINLKRFAIDIDLTRYYNVPDIKRLKTKIQEFQKRERAKETDDSNTSCLLNLRQDTSNDGIERSQMVERLKLIRAKMAAVKAELHRREKRETRRNVSVEVLRQRVKEKIGEARAHGRESVLERRRQTVVLNQPGLHSVFRHKAINASGVIKAIFRDLLSVTKVLFIA